MMYCGGQLVFLLSKGESRPPFLPHNSGHAFVPSCMSCSQAVTLILHFSASIFF